MQVKHENCSKVGGKDDIWPQGAFRAGEVILIERHAKSIPKSLPGGLFSLPIFACEDKKC